MDKKSKASVESPSDSREGLAKNLGGMPPVLDVKEIWEEATPPDHPARGSVTTMGSEGGGKATD